jgi:WD40 repeat protein
VMAGGAWGGFRAAPCTRCVVIVIGCWTAVSSLTACAPCPPPPTLRLRYALYNRSRHNPLPTRAETDRSAELPAWESHGWFLLSLQVWDLVSGQATATLKGHTDWVRACDVSPDGSRIASGGYDRTVMLWDAATGRHQRSLTGHAGWVWSVAFSPCGRLVVSGSEDCTAKLWETTTGRCVATLRGHSHYVRSVQFWDGGRYVISTSDDCTVKVWSVAEALANEERCGAVGVGCEALEHAASVRSVPRGVFVKWQAAGRVPLSHSQLELSLHVQPSGGGGGGGGGGGSGSYDECCGRSVILTASGELVWCDACVRTLGGATDSIISATVSSDGRWLATATHNLACTSPHGGGLVFPGGSDACCDVSSKKTSLMSRLLQSPLLGLSGLSLLSGGLALTCAEPKPKPAAGAACLRVWDTTTWTLKAELRGDAHRIAAVRFLAAPPPSPVC